MEDLFRIVLEFIVTGVQSATSKVKVIRQSWRR